jgi:TRAP transporter TAXI family solute receptor
MRRYLLFCSTVVVWVSGLLCVPQVKADSMGLMTGPTTGTYFQFGQDIARVARTVGLEILVKESEESIDNIQRLVSRENAALGIVQSDVLGFLSRSEDPDVRRISERLRLVFPFYNEEVHLLARREIRRFEDLDGKRVVIGTKGSDNWVTSNNLLRMISIKPTERIELPPPEGASAVLRGKADALVYVGDKPVKLFTTFQELQKNPQFAPLVRAVHFVPLTHPNMLQEYAAATIGPDDYAWVSETIPTVAVKAVLISFDFSSRSNPYYQKRCDQLAKLGVAIREEFTGRSHSSKSLQRAGHPKWREVDLNQDLGIWKRDTCSQPAAPEPATETEEAVVRTLTEILKGKRPPR